ncbi:MAG: hypothetical protein WD009_09710 [Phycisphaeraceae bacterium]
MMSRLMMTLSLRPVCLGLPVLLLGLALPLAGLERFEGDAAPLLVAFAVVAVAVGCFVYAHRPEAVESYAAGTAMVFVILLLIVLVGVLSTTPATAMGADMLLPGM